MIPKRYRINSTIAETPDTFTMTLSPLEEKIAPFFPGQFNMLYPFGFGEIPISISGDPFHETELTHTIRAVGPVTEALQRLKAGDEIGVRGPFGTAWPLEHPSRNILIIAGGLGLAPLRPVLIYLAKKRELYKNITLLYGARTPDDLLYRKEKEKWEQWGIEVIMSVDRGSDNWQGNVGVITMFINKHLSDPQCTRIFLCGPEIMMHFAVNEILRFNVSHEEIFLSLERNMKCAVGFCGHCQYGPYFLCKDGPVFSYKQLKKWISIKEL